MEHREDHTELLMPSVSTPLSTLLSRRSFLTRSGYSVATLLALSLWDGTGAPPALARSGGRAASAGQGLRLGARLGATPAALQLPFWSDGANWDWPEYYETIQAARRQTVKTFQGADLNGDGNDELIARGPAGLLINRFDPASGQWIQLPAGPPLTDAAGWDAPQYIETIQCADIDGDEVSELIVRGPDRMHLWKYDPSNLPAYSEILPLQDNGQPGGWPVWSDANGWNQPQYYQTIQLADIDGDGTAELIGRAPDGDPSGAGIHVWQYAGVQVWQGLWNSRIQWPGPDWSDAAGWNAPQYYETIQCADVNGDGAAELIGSGPQGLEVWAFSNGVLPAVPGWAPAAWQSAPYFRTIQCADIDGDGRAELLARSASGMVAFKFTAAGAWVQLANGPAWSDARGWNAPPYYETIQCADIDGDGAWELLGRAPDSDPNGPGIQVWKYDPTTNSWSQLPSGPAWTDAAGWDQVQYYRTIQTARALPGTIPAVPPVMVANPGFESPSVGAGNWGIGVGDGWGWQGFSGVYAAAPNDLKPPEGLQAADIVINPATEFQSAAYQQISGFAAGVRYAITFYAVTGDTPIAPGTSVDVFLDGNPQNLDGQKIGRAVVTHSWSRFRTATIMPGPGTHTITFTPNVGIQGLVDYVQVAPVSNQAAVLLGRDSQGIKTWRYDPVQRQWNSSSATFPAFSGDQLTAYNYLTSYWGIVNGGVRDHYNDQTTVINTWLDDLKNNRIPAPSGVTTADWQAVTSQIQSELQAVSYVQDWFGSLTNTLITEIYLGQQMNVQTVGNYLSLSSSNGDATFLSILSLFFNGAWAVLGVPGLNAGNESAIAGILATAFSAAATAVSGGGTYQGAYAGLQAALTNSFNQAITANGNNQQAITGGTGADPNTGQPVRIPGDYGLLMAIGQMVASTVWSWPASTGPLVTAAQYQYALSLWKALIGLAWWAGVDQLDGPPQSFPSQYLYPPGYSVDGWWLTNSGTGFTFPDPSSLSALFDAPAAGDIFPLGAAVADVYLGQNGWPALPLQNFTPNINSGRPPYVPPARGADLRVRAKLTRDAATGEFLAAITVSNHGLKGATNVEVMGGQLGSKLPSPLSVPTRHIRLAPGKSRTLLLRFPKSTGTAGERAVLRLSGRYQGGTFGTSLRVTIP